MNANDLPNVGDLARVIRVCGCCEQSRRLLDRFVVVRLIADVEQPQCGHCKRIHPASEMALDERGTAFIRANLRRIPPLSELESVHIADEIASERPRRERVEA